MTTHPFNLSAVHPSWKAYLQAGLAKVAPDYLEKLAQDKDWLPGADKIFNAFTLPIDKVNYVLFGESPYPRRESANGYAFWDTTVNELWSPTGLSKAVNRATSLRNLIKMLLVAEGILHTNTGTGQSSIAKLDKKNFWQLNQELFTHFLHHGFLLLNATPVLQAHSPQKDARAWQNFTAHILTSLLQYRPHVTFLLLGNIAHTIDSITSHMHVEKIYAEHPYNQSFIHNQEIIRFFQPLHLLKKTIA
jgi:uracil-DNA glycosylase